MTTIPTLSLDEPLHLAVAWRDKKKVAGGQIGLAKTVAENFRDIAKEHLKGLGNRKRCTYSPEIDLQPSSHYLAADLADFGSKDPILTLLNKVSSQDVLSIDSVPRQALLFYAFVFPGQAAFLRKTNPYQTAHKGKSYTTFAGTLKRISNPVFVFDSKIDLVVLGDELLISSTSAFELLFKDNRYLVRNIPIWVDAVTDHLPITGKSKKVLVDRCKSNTRLRNRLETIHRRGHLQKVDMRKICKYAEDNGLDVKDIVWNGKLRFQDASVDDLLKLLNEDLFRGGLTGQRFAADKKTRSGL